MGMGDKVDFVAEGDDLLKNCPSGVDSIVERAGWGKRTVRVGNKEWACDSTSSIGVSQDTELRQKGQIVVYVSVSDDTSSARRVVSVLGIVDPIEAEAKSCVGD